MKKRILKIISAIISAAVLFTCGMIPANASYDFISHGVPKNREELEALKEYIATYPEDEDFDICEIYFKETGLNEEQLAKCEEYILSDDRESLFDFLLEFYTNNRNALTFECLYEDLVYYTTRRTGHYVPVDDLDYMIILYTCVFSHYEYKLALSPAPVNKGDINMDGRVSLHDIIMANKMSTGIVIPGNKSQAAAADVDDSYVIDHNDVNYIMQYVIGLSDSFPENNNG